MMQDKEDKTKIVQIVNGVSPGIYWTSMAVPYFIPMSVLIVVGAGVAVEVTFPHASPVLLYLAMLFGC